MINMKHALPIIKCDAFFACLHMTMRARKLIDVFHVYPVPPPPVPVRRGHKDGTHTDVFARAWAAVGAQRDAGRSRGTNDR